MKRFKYNVAPDDSSLMNSAGARWRGEWITPPGDSSPRPSSRFGGSPPARRERVLLFRREFRLPTRPVTALLRLTSNSRHILHVNGREVLRGPIRSSARHIHFDTLDISEHLVAGMNCIAVLVRHYGFATPWWEPAPLTGPGGIGGLALEAEIHGIEVFSDSSWRATSTEAWLPSRPRDEISAQLPERFDAGLLDPRWTMPGFDDSAWEHAEVVTAVQFGRKGSTSPPFEPFGRPHANPLPHPEHRRREPQRLWQVARAHDPSDAIAVLRETLAGATAPPEIGADAVRQLPARVSAGACLVLDFGGIVSGIVAFRLTAERGTRMAISLVETLAPFTLDSANLIEYTARGAADGYESLEFMGGRFALVTALDEGEATIDDLAVTEHRRPRPAGLGFHCDDDSLNEIYSVALRTVDLCSRDAYLDCPTREQRAWVADSVIHQSVDLTCNANWTLAVRNTQLLDNPRGDGLLPMAAAADFSDPGLIAIPDASLHWTRSVHNLYRYTGHQDTVAALMPTFESIVRWFLPFQHGDNLLHDVTGWTLIDWAPTEVEAAVASLNGLWGRALLDFSEIAEWLGNHGQARWARAMHARLSEGFELFWDADRSIYVDSLRNGTRSRRLSEHANAAAVVGGLVPTARHPRMAQVLLDRDRVVDPMDLVTDHTPSTFFRRTLELRHEPNWDVEHLLVAAQPFFRYVVHDALAVLGKEDALPDLIRDWDRLLAIGPSALREVWGGQSYAHAWSATPARDLVRYVAGISPAEPGFATVRIAPRLGRLRELAVTAPTPHGPVHVEVKNGVLSLKSPRPVVVVSPDGTVSEHPAGSARLAWPE